MNARSSVEQRYEQIERIVRKFTKRHIAIDVSVGAAGLLPVPGAGTASIVAAIGAQGPLIYQPMVRELSALYAGSHSSAVDGIAAKAWFAGGVADCAAEFGSEFFKESAQELLQEHGSAIAAGAMPVIGGVIAAALDVFIAVKLTRIVAAMALVHLENGGRWPVSRQSTALFVRTLLLARPDAPLSEVVSDAVGPLYDPERTFAAGTFADGVTEGVHLSAEASGVHETVVEAVERWRNVDPHTMDAFEQAFTAKSGVYADPGLLAALKGFVGEQIASNATGGELPDATNVKAWDMLWNGQEWQIKVGTTAAQRLEEAYQADPTYPLISDPATAEYLQAHGYPAVGVAGLEPEHVMGLTEQTALSIHELAHIAPDIPVISAVIITFFELRRVAKGEQTMRQALAAITVNVGSRSAAITLASLVGVGLAVAAGTLPVSGPFLAGAAVSGSLGGRLLADRIMQMRVPPQLREQCAIGWQRLSAAEHFAYANAGNARQARSQAAEAASVVAEMAREGAASAMETASVAAEKVQSFLQRSSIRLSEVARRLRDDNR